MVSGDFCQHDWPGSGCPDCRAERTPDAPTLATRDAEVWRVYADMEPEQGDDEEADARHKSWRDSESIVRRIAQAVSVPLATRDAEIVKAVAAEREACAALLGEHSAACRTNAEFWKTHGRPSRQEVFEGMADECEDAAAAIRSRAALPHGETT